MAYQMATTAMTLNELKVIHRLQVFSNAIRRTFVGPTAFYTISTDSVLARFLYISRTCFVSHVTTA